MKQLIVENVSKSFGKEEIIKQANFVCHSGIITGIVGENGSGKTVLMKLIIGLKKATKGRILYDNLQLKKDFDYLPSVGIIIEAPGFFDELTGFENLQALAKIRGRISDADIVSWMQKVGLENDSKIVENYSLGMRQRLGIAQALMENPDVLILDEFTNGLDEEGIEMAHRLLVEEKNKGKIIVISSHSRYDIQQLCDEIYVLKGGVLYHASSKDMDKHNYSPSL